MTSRSRTVAAIRAPRIVRLEPGGVETALTALAADLTHLRGGAVTLDLGALGHVDAGDLRAFGEVVRAARAGEVEVRCAAVAPRVYKALHLAKLGPLVTRVPGGLGETEAPS